MDVKEKMVELINEVQETGVNEIPAGFGCTRQYISNEKVATHLISHGVTVQKWISVDDRLPEFGERVICTDGYAVFEQYRVEPSCVYGMWDRFGLKSPMQEVTHWMPLPQPPKGE